MNTKLIPEDIGEHFLYDPETGDLINLKTDNRVGSVGRKGYVRVVFRNKFYMVHRIAWFLMTGEQPPTDMQIDHINRDPRDNRWKNLRLATPAQNSVYREFPEGAMPRGVRAKKNRFVATIHQQSRKVQIGSFRTPEEAMGALSAAKDRMYGSEFNVGSNR